MNLKPCPGCGSYITVMGRQGNKFQVACGGIAEIITKIPYVEVYGGCGVTGPFAVAPKEAKELWNKMASKK